MAQDDAFVFGDALPDAPELAARGDYAVGVQTLEFVNPGQVDILNLSAENPTATYDRPLTVEVWYPAILAENQAELVAYEETLGRADQPDSLIPFTFMGRAARDAEPDTTNAPYPLIIISHGY
ncbi:MAG: dienelactone hydrolase, partial [Anaerolineae bacterium]|nr:dienelactone hydrolase [Anaerolineae bacterium]